jgi:multisubunit Na+/H+ antiporter MnhG subunit
MVKTPKVDPEPTEKKESSFDIEKTANVVSKSVREIAITVGIVVISSVVVHTLGQIAVKRTPSKDSE